MGMEIERKTIKRNLDFQKTLQYFMHHIDGGGFLEECILKKIAFSKGAFFMLLPEDAKMDQLYRFDEGGINPKVTTDQVSYLEKTGSFTPKKQIVTSREVSDHIKLFLDENNDSFALCEDVIRSPKDPHVKIGNVDLHFFGDHIYYRLSNKNTLEEIHATIRKTDNTWHSLIVLYSGKKLEQNLQSQDFIAVCENIRYIITSAHDSENFIIWENLRR